jgi:hypothetical protein
MKPFTDILAYKVRSTPWHRLRKQSLPQDQLWVGLTRLSTAGNGMLDESTAHYALDDRLLQDIEE